MIPDFHHRKRTRFNLEANTMNTEYTPDPTKPVPTDHTQFLADPYKYRITEEFLDSVVLEVSWRVKQTTYYFPCQLYHHASI